MSSRPSAASNNTSSQSEVERKNDQSPPPKNRSTPSSSSSPIAVPRLRTSYKRDEGLDPVLSPIRAATFGGLSPLLSERDSIFAEHYLPSQNETPTSPQIAEQARAPRLPEEKQWSKSNLDLSASPSPPQTQRSPYVKRLSFDKNISTKHRSATTAASTAAPHVLTQLPLHGIRRVASDIQDLDLVAHPLPRRSGIMVGSLTSDQVRAGAENGLDQIQDASESTAEQRQGRGISMKQAISSTRPDRSSSRGRSHVEKSIEVTLPKTEQITNARSRKSSHYMGLFRDNTTPSDTDLSLSRGLRSHENLAQLRASSVRPDSAHSQEVAVEGTHDVDRNVSTASVDRPTLRSWSATRSAPGHVSSPLQSTTFLDASVSRWPPAPSPTKLVGQHDPYFRAHDEIKQQLLQQIRQSRLDKEGHVAQDVDIHQTADHEPVSAEVEQRSTSKNHVEAEEHMSKVEYKPHAGRIPEDIEGLADVDVSLGETTDHGQDLAEVEHFDARRAAAKTPPPEHIDIFIESKHEKKAFHGSYQPPEDVEEDFEFQSDKLPPISEYPDTKVSSASETELESGDEEALERHADDGEVTPTGLVDYQNLFRPRRKSRPAQPKAVVLDQYSHQVGGHSTIFHFSRQAVCKKLNNRENEFYERVELRHPDLLRFLPK